MNTATLRHDVARSEPLLSATDVEVLLGAATRAPSLYNSQPWAFTVGPGQIQLYADPARQVPHADPAGRSLHVSCGAALFNLRVAAEHLGFHAHVRLLPDKTDPTLMAVLHVDHRRPRVGALGRYYSAIGQRRTNRAPFRNHSLPHAVLAALDEAVRAQASMLRCYDDPAEVTRIIELLGDADVADALEPARSTERQTWAGVRDFPEFEAAPTVAILSTRHDKPIDWLRAGQALQRLLLEATLAGVSASFLNHPLEFDGLRPLVASPATGVGHSQMVVRLGYGPEVLATPRRPLAQVQRAAGMR